MKASIIYTTILTALFTLFFSCGSGDEPTPTPPTPPRPEEPKPTTVSIPINISVGNWTRATDTSFESGDAIGIYVVNYNGNNPGVLANSGNHVNNMRFTYTTTWTPDQQIFWKDASTHADFYAFYPYGTVSNVSSYSFSVQTDQSTEAGYKKSDFLWGKTTNVTPSTNAVGITTKHVFSNAIVKLIAGDGFTQEEIDQAKPTVKLMNVKAQSQINLSTGTATPTGGNVSVTLRNEGSQYRALIIPQAVEADTQLVLVTINGQDFSLSSSGMEFVANKQHTFTVTLKKSGSGIDVGIGGWDTDGTDHGGNAQ